MYGCFTCKYYSIAYERLEHPQISASTGVLNQSPIDTVGQLHVYGKEERPGEEWGGEKGGTGKERRGWEI